MWARAVPIVLWGDEGTHNFKSWMLFSWMLDVSLWRTNSKASRNLAFACPVNMYRSHEKVNQTLQALLQAVKADLDGLAKGLEVCGEAAQLIDCVHVWTFHVVACKGDLKYLAQSLNLTRFPGCEEVCFRCLASMGRQDPSLVYTDLSEAAAWRTRPAPDPWSERPCLSLLDGFSLRMVSTDWMHTWHLGVARDLVGAAMKICLKSQFWPGPNLARRFSAVQRRLNDFKAQHGLQMHLKRLSKSRLAWEDGTCPEFKSSAADTGVMIRFVASELSDRLPPEPYEGLAACAWLADQLQEAVMRAGLFLSDSEVEQTLMYGRAFLASYMKLAKLANVRRELYFKVRPKFHYLTHLIEDVQTRPSRRSLGWDSCWIDEDWVKVNLRMLRRMSARTCHEHLLYRNLIVVRHELEKRGR
ncbi:unnamed protein product [Effrenium voratum]|nr:unnamed protein product [Effrenium voratum]